LVAECQNAGGGEEGGIEKPPTRIKKGGERTLKKKGRRKMQRVTLSKKINSGLLRKSKEVQHEKKEKGGS